MRIPPGVPEKVVFMYSMHERARHSQNKKPMPFMEWAKDRRDIPGYEPVAQYLDSDKRR